jgi:hypothetical protein
MRVEALPFDVDVDLVSYLKQSEENDGTKKDVAKELFPVHPILHQISHGPLILCQDSIDIISPSPITDSEKAEVAIRRRISAQRRAGPFWTGTKVQWSRFEASTGRGRGLEDCFEVATGIGGKGKRGWRLVDLGRIKVGMLSFSTSFLCVGADVDG